MSQGAHALKIESHVPLDPVTLYSKCLEAPERREFFTRFPIGVSWALTIEIMLKDLIFSKKSGDEKVLSLQKTYLYSIDQEDETTKDLTLGYWISYFSQKGIQLDKLPGSIQESNLYTGNKIVLWKGRRLSLDFLSKLNLAHDMIAHTRHVQNPTFLEIGGGYGQLARVLKLMRPDSKYAVLDLPETLYFSYLFLSSNFPEAKIVWPTTAEEAKQAIASGDYDFCLIPCFFSECLPESATFAAAVNKSSFGEMNNKSSNFYIDVLQSRLRVEYLFSLNRYLNSVDPLIQAYRSEENQWYNYLDDKWEIVTWELEPEFTRFPYNEIYHHRELYLIAKRSSQAQAHPDISDILLSVWYKSFTLVPFARHSKILASDLCKGGVLQRLTDAVRLNPSETSVDALIKYIYLLEGKFPFEDRFFYTNLYKEITQRRHPLASADPLFNYRMGRILLRVTGFAFLLNHPALNQGLIRGLRAFGVNIKWTYDFLKRMLFNERK